MTTSDNGTILLLNPPFRQKVIRSYYCCFTSKADYLWPPIDLLVQSGVLSDRYHVEVIDAVAEGLSEQDLLNRTRNKHYQAILSLTGTYTWRDDFPLLERLVKRTPSPLFVSGNITLFRPEFFLEQYPFLTGILHNFTSDDLLNYLDGNGKNSLEALSYRKPGNQGLHLGERNIHPGQPIRYPIPRHKLFPLKNYSTPLAKRLPMTVLLTSFGCPFHCTFCVSSTLELCQRPIEEVVQEMEKIQSLGIREVFIEDNTFTANKNYVHLLCQRMVEEKIHLNWTCNIHASTVDRTILQKMKEAGCHLVQIGIESASDEMLKKHKKGASTSRISECLTLCKELGLKTLGYFIIGLPGDTENSIRETIDYSIRLNPTYASFSLATPDYGTQMREEILQDNHFNLPNDSFDSSSTPAIISEKLLPKNMRELHQLAYLRFYLRPKKILELAAFQRWNTLIKNGFSLIKKYAVLTCYYKN